jgi:hypothetical protein
MRGKRAIPLPTELNKLATQIEDLGDRCFNVHQVFYDFIEMAAIALSKLDRHQAEAR